MPITFVKEHGLIDSEGKGGWGRAGGCLPDRVCIQALRALSGLQAMGASWQSPPPRETAHPDTRLLGVRREGEVSAAANGCFPSTRPVELQTLVFEQACGGGLGCESE